jgi:hypothetical protein
VGTERATVTCGVSERGTGAWALARELPHGTPSDHSGELIRQGFAWQLRELRPERLLNGFLIDTLIQHFADEKEAKRMSDALKE